MSLASLVIFILESVWGSTLAAVPCPTPFRVFMVALPDLTSSSLMIPLAKPPPVLYTALLVTLVASVVSSSLSMVPLLVMWLVVAAWALRRALGGGAGGECFDRAVVGKGATC